MAPISRPIPIEIGAPQIQDGLRSFYCPAHPSPLHAVLDQMSTGAFGHTRADGVSGGQVFIIAHMGAVVVEIGNEGLDGFAILAFQGVFRRHLFEATDDITDFACQQHLQALPDPAFRRRAAFPMKDMGPFPQILHECHRSKMPMASGR